MPVTVLVAAAFVPSPQREARWLAFLPESRRETLLGWRDAADRHRSLIGTRLLAHALARFGHPEAALATLRHPPRARPTLAVPLEFSIAHSGGRVACALSDEGPVGIDVEAVVDGVDASGFVRSLSAGERGWAGTSAERFAAVWTKKEAIAKAAGGLGLAALQRIDTAAVADDGAVAFDGRRWRTIAVDGGRGYAAHLAIRADAADLGAATVTIARLRRDELERSPEPGPAAPAANAPP